MERHLPHNSSRQARFSRRRLYRFGNAAWLAATLSACWLSVGCESDDVHSIQLSPTDFASPTASPARAVRIVELPEPSAPGSANTEDHGAQPGDAPTGVSQSGVASASGPSSRSATADTRGDGDAGPRMILNAMVGQVNGNPIFANEVLSEIDAELTALAKRLPPQEFLQRAQSRIAERLEQLIIDALILGEARRTLSARDAQIINLIADNQRDELIRKYGMGAMTVADAELRRLNRAAGKGDLGLEGTLEEFRQQQVVKRYMQVRVLSRINVTRRDIERFYADNPDQFNPPPVRTVRVIRVRDDASLARITQALADRKPFADVAADPEAGNLFRVDEGGLWGEIEGEPPFADDAVNEALLALGEGQTSEAIPVRNEHWLLHVDKLVDPGHISLLEAQSRIESFLSESRFQTETGKLRAEFFRTGSYTPINTMGTTLMRIAAARYLMTAGES